MKRNDMKKNDMKRNDMKKNDMQKNDIKLTPSIIVIKRYQTKLNNNNKNKLSKGLSPTSDSEFKYNPSKWNNNSNIKLNQNCYSYAFNDIKLSREGKAQPGYYANYPPIDETEYNCKAIFKRIKRDNPSVYKTKFKEKCQNGFYKAYYVLALSDDTDYHFYRQDSNGNWSHKPGRTNVTNLDASDKVIKNPSIANRDYGTYNYKKGCDFFCLHPKLTKTFSQSNKNKNKNKN